MMHAGHSREGVFGHLRALFHSGTAVGVDDLRLLQRFVNSRDAGAFEAIVARHGPMVLGVCRRLLANPSDVEDAFQATFLVLVRRAASLRNADLLSPWLYGVATRVALRARATRSEPSGRTPRLLPAGDGARRADEGLHPGRSGRAQASWPPTTPVEDVTPCPSEALEERELRGVLDEEIARLPERFRRPVVLCYFEGLTHQEAARRLRCPLGTVNSRLATARERLRERLTRRGLAPTAGVLGVLAFAAGAEAGVSPEVPTSLLESTVRAAFQFTHGSASAACTISATALALAKGVLNSMFLTKLKIATAVLSAAGIVFLGAGLIAGQVASDNGSSPPAANSAPAPDAKRAESDIRQILREAARVAASAEDDLSKAQTLCQIAREQRSAGDRAAARVNLQLAARTARGLTGDYRGPENEWGDARQSTLGEIAIAQAEAGFGSDAIETARGLEDQWGPFGGGPRDQLLAKLSTTLADAEDYDNALKAAGLIRDERGKLQSITDVTTRMIKAGDVDGAIRAAELLKSTALKYDLLTVIGFTQSQEGDPAGARLWAEKLDPPILKSQVLLGIARGLSQRMQDQAAAEKERSATAAPVEKTQGTRKGAARKRR
jgi:RNA polymerase sigma factor (sigma-70 family)